MPFTSTARGEIRANDESYAWRLSLQFLGAVLAIIAIGTFASIPAGWVHDADYEPFFSSSVQKYVYIPLGITIIFFVINLSYLSIRKEPIPPSLAASIDLILLLLDIIFTVSIFNNAYNEWYYTHHSPAYLFDRHLIDDGEALAMKIGAPIKANQERIADREFTGAICLLILVVVQAGLFVWACVDVLRERGSGSAKATAQTAQEPVAEMRESAER